MPVLLLLNLLDPWWQPEVFYEIGYSILPSCRISGCFLRNEPLGFSKLWHGIRNSYQVVCNRARLLEKHFCPKNWGNALKLGQIKYLKKNLAVNENLDHFLCHCANSIFGRKSCF